MATPFYNVCLKKELEARIEKNRRYSLRAFAQALGINPGALSQILSGSRHPSYKMAQQILENLSLAPEEQREFLGSLTRVQKLRNLKRLGKAFHGKPEKSTLKQDTAQKELSFELFKVISDWYHYAILEMTFLPDFKASASFIAKRLGISEMEAKLALERLKDLELLADAGKSLKKTDGRITLADKTMSAPALRKRQKQVLEKSMHALENTPIEKRNHSAHTMCIDPSKIPEAKKRILEFNRELCRFLEDGNRTEVYEMQVSLFPLTQTKPHSLGEKS